MSASPVGQAVLAEVPKSHHQHCHASFSQYNQYLHQHPSPAALSHPSLPEHLWGRAPSNSAPSVISPHSKSTITGMQEKPEASTGIAEGAPLGLPEMSLAAVTANSHISVAAVSPETLDVSIHREGTRGGDGHPAVRHKAPWNEEVTTDHPTPGFLPPPRARGHLSFLLYGISSDPIPGWNSVSSTSLLLLCPPKCQNLDPKRHHPDPKHHHPDPNYQNPGSKSKPQNKITLDPKHTEIRVLNAKNPDIKSGLPKPPKIQALKAKTPDPKPNKTQVPN